METHMNLRLTPQRTRLLADAVTQWIENTDEDDPAYQHDLAVARDLQEELDGRIAAAAGYDGPAGSNREDLPTNEEKRAMLRAHMGRGGKVDGYR